MSQEIKVKRIAAIGVGTQGSAVAFACAIKGIDVYLLMKTFEKAERARDKLIQNLHDKRMIDLKKNEIEKAVSYLHPCHDLEQALENADCAFESVYEDLKYKIEIHHHIGRLAPPHILIGTNTSSFLCQPLAEASGRPQNFFCMNWTDIRYKERVVMIMWNSLTSDSTKQSVIKWAKDCNMVPLICSKDVMGYGYNQVWRVIKKHSLKLADEGAINIEDLDRFMVLCFGMKYGPFALMDRIGLDTVLEIEKAYYKATGKASDKPPRLLTDLVDAGHLGSKSGKGFYSYPNPVFKKSEWLYKRPPFDD